MSHRTAPRARRSPVAPWAALLLVLVLATGCTAAPRPATQQPDPFRDTFVTANGLLAVPELWKSLERSTTAGLLRHLALAAAGRPTSWRLSADDTFAALSAESDPVQAASLVTEAGFGHRGLWSEADLLDWWQVAVSEADIDREAAIARISDDPRRLPVDDALLQAWRTAVEGPDILPALLATDLLGLFAGPDVAEPRPATINFRSPGEAATYLRRAAASGQASPDALDPQILTIAREAIATDDRAMYDLARAYADAGQQSAAGAVVDAMDPRRLLADGEVLEVPLFEGTVGSSFRMVRTLAAQNRLDVLSPDVRRTLVEQARALLEVDVSHRVAGLALINLLEPGSVAPDQATTAIGAALREATVGTKPFTSPAQAIGWTTVAEYADALGVRLDYPGIAAGAVAEWVAVTEPLVEVSISRFLLALDRSGQLRPDALTQRLAGRVRSALLKPARTPSLLLFSGALAVHAATGGWAVPVAELRTQSTTRDGGCLGDFDGFVRDLPSHGTACDTDASWFAIVLLKELDR